MNALHSSVRNDVLRVALAAQLDGFADAQEEFLKILEQHPEAVTVIVELPNVAHLSGDSLRCVVNFRRITEVSGRRFRINGVSQLVDEVLSRLGQASVSAPRTKQFSNRAGFATVS